jgi:hypothetical protein
MKTVADIMADYILKQNTIINTRSIIIDNGPQTLLFKLNSSFYLDYPIDSGFNLTNNLATKLHKNKVLHTLTTFYNFTTALENHTAYDTTLNLVKHQYRTVLKLIRDDITELSVKQLMLMPSLVTLKTKLDSISTIVTQLDTLLTQIEDYIDNGS